MDIMQVCLDSVVYDTQQVHHQLEQQHLLEQTTRLKSRSAERDDGIERD